MQRKTMVSDSLNPYEIDEEESLDYTFITKDGIKYHASFYSVEPLYPEFVDTYSFSIEPEDKRSHPMNRRIAITIAEILKRLIVISDFVLLNASNDTQRSRNGIMDILFVQGILAIGQVTNLTSQLSLALQAKSGSFTTFRHFPIFSFPQNDINGLRRDCLYTDNLP